MRKCLMRAFAFLAMLFLAFFALSFSTFADESQNGIPQEEWEDFLDSVPPEALEYFPNGEFEAIDEYSDAVNQMTSPSYVVETLLGMIGVEVGGAFKLLLLLVGVVVVSAVISSLSKMADNPTLSAVMRYCSLGAVFSSVVYVFYEHCERLEDFFERISAFFIE